MGITALLRYFMRMLQLISYHLSDQLSLIELNTTLLLLCSALVLKPFEKDDVTCELGHLKCLLNRAVGLK